MLTDRSPCINRASLKRKADETGCDRRATAVHSLLRQNTPTVPEGINTAGGICAAPDRRQAFRLIPLCEKYGNGCCDGFSPCFPCLQGKMPRAPILIRLYHRTRQKSSPRRVTVRFIQKTLLFKERLDAFYAHRLFTVFFPGIFRGNLPRQFLTSSIIYAIILSW